MIYIAQLIYLQPGKEKEFLKFESKVIPLMKEHGGKIIQRIRPNEQAFIEGEEKKPYEIHIVTFPDYDALEAYGDDPKRTKYLKLREASIESTLLIQQTV